MIELVTGHCPYCAEPIELEVDTSAGEQDYIEDCFVCCRPIQVRVRLGADGAPSVSLRDEDEA